MKGLTRKIVLAGMVGILLVVIVIAGGWVCLSNRPPGACGPVTVEVKKGMTASRIAFMLHEKELIRSAACFKLLSRVRGYSRTFKAGQWRLDGTLSAMETAWLLTLNPPVPPDIRVTVFEGLSIRETASLLAKEAKIDSAAFTGCATDSGIARQLGIDNGSLEGYLYPDTYFVRVGTTPKEMIERMVSRFNRVFSDSLRARADSLKMSVRDVVTLASIIECETGLDEERPLISAVYRRRLKSGVPLQACPTVQYVLGSKRRLLDEDLKIESPYNTYLHPGLPPGPIASPGMKSLHAALYPADSTYLYFVSDGKGGNIFSRTLSEHNRAVRLFKKQRKQSSMR
ncbi:endolytic transglycosylase MltG [bacterium]|nr:endolytic transglycosylase MltG [bacterium]